MPVHLIRPRATAADPVHRAFVLLRTVSTVAPIASGPDGSAGLLTDRPGHAPAPGTAAGA
ncbi:hypothetical protein ACI78V_04820 [Geodermatophilus sp. SYSU D00742]